ncbi:SH3 domain-containing protein [Clostridium sp. MSJ-8]|uniref:L,D-transpeptidase family protein n=1 Tax=Clostridium sp. MSJ-8 TaxID=2841510 RepID=UPI001C0EABE9|nr:SH3 domain-containing protein [Clostridium sp. MSJ-8]MBU5487976.1 SH3 domain-containing protein [Clostridium sp. MSJ-8]
MYRNVIYKYALRNVNLRSEKSDTSSIITVIPKGAKMILIDGEEDWLKVKYGEDEGYVYNKYISKTLYTWKNVQLREEPSFSGKLILTVPKKSRVESVENVGNWNKVIYNGREGYIYSFYLSDDGNKDDLDYEYYYTNMVRFVNENGFLSSSEYLLVTDIQNRETYVFIKEEGKWVKLYKWLCTVGKPSTPTIKGIFYISGRKPYFGTDKYRVKYATRIRGPYYYHSILYNAEGTKVINSTLGEALSHGCIRLETYNAEWIYDNIPDETTVFIH